ncbi:glycosyltransferase [Luminiphilus sp.]|nr:glycosyltransferase [Luminiphilus sp.]
MLEGIAAIMVNDASLVEQKTGVSSVVDIVIPIYANEGQVRACLSSVLAHHNEIQGDIIVVNDCSPEPEIHQYLAALADQALITLLTNEQNEGFIVSCNRGAAVHPDNDFVLLNADTEVHGNWLDRMVSHVAPGAKVATVTPFSNNATIASYPKDTTKPASDEDVPTAAIDLAMAAVNAGSSVALPTAIGFCMFVSREAWRITGGFDKRYGRGYGEENEFCLATAALGWRHLLACDVFVYHAGGGSFGVESTKRKAEAQQIIDQRYPDFSRQVQDWIREDPAQPARLRCTIERLTRFTGPRVLHITHHRGGGVEEHAQSLAHHCAQNSDGLNLALRPYGEKGIAVESLANDTQFRELLDATKSEALVLKLARALGIQRLHFHHYADLPQWVLALPDHLNIPFDVTVHDFVTACPQFHFQDDRGKYCGRPDDAGCNICIENRQNPWGLTIEAWRGLFSEHLLKAERVICPSAFVASVIEEYYEGVATCIWPHPEVIASTLSGHRSMSQSRIKIAVVGSLLSIKGYDLLATAIQRSEADELPIDFAIIGATEKPLPKSTRALVTGPYQNALLPYILLRERPDCFLFLSQVPETYNYTLTACLATGLPIVALSMGAFEERLEGLARASLLPADTDATTLIDTLLAQPRAYRQANDAVKTELVVTSPAEYVGRYLAPLSLPEPINREALMAVLVELEDINDRPLAPLPPIEVLLSGALDARSEEAQAALRVLVADQVALVAQQETHLAARAGEVTHLNDAISELKQASEHEVSHFKRVINELKQAAEHEATHLKMVIGELKEVIEDLRNPGLMNILLILVRYLRSRFRRARFVIAVPLDFLKRAYLAIRYHYAMGGVAGVVHFINRRWVRWRERNKALNTPYQDQSDPLEHDMLPSLPEGPIDFSASLSPELSIVIPSYGQHQMTADCLRAIFAQPPSVSFEVIVVDDAYEEPFDPEALGLAGVKVLRHERNQGFLRACNSAVKTVLGCRVLLLNNDTQVLAGAIDALWHTFDRFSDVGAVGAKLLYPNGVLQEAGGIIWRDGSGWNWGRDEDAGAPRFNYVREADYCSAAALMVDTALWGQLGGFDERFAPCYYEDTDLCFAVREVGKRVLYQPAAQVIHFEGVSNGTDTSSGLKAYQLSNQSGFVAKWGHQLAHHAPNGVMPERECDRKAKVRVLWVEACVLTPDQDSGSLRTFRLLRILIQLGCKVTFAANNLLADEPYSQALRDEGIEVLHAPYVQSMSDYLRAKGNSYDVVVLCRHYIAIGLVDLLRECHPKTKVWFDTIDLHYLRLRRQYELDGKSATRDLAEHAYQEESQVIAKSHMTIVVSEVEAATLAQEIPSAKVALISNVHDVGETKTQFEGRQGILFVGGFQHPPNIDAVEYYGNEIWPLVRAACPEAETIIIGSRMPDSLKKWGEQQGLTMLGFVEDLSPHYEQCRLAIAPLRYGAGVKGKVNQALSFGVPVVGSPAAVEGMGLVHGENVLSASTPRAFADAILAVYDDAQLWRTLSDNGRASLEGRFTSQVAATALREALTASLGDWDRETGC